MTVDPNSIDLPAFMAEHLHKAVGALAPTMEIWIDGFGETRSSAICGRRTPTSGLRDLVIRPTVRKVLFAPGRGALARARGPL
jgi:hypothetical protein